MERDVVIVSSVRTPFGRFGGCMKDLPLEDLGACAIREVLQRVNLPGDVVEELYLGNCNITEMPQAPSVVGRQIALRAGLPESLFSLTLDAACTSSLVAARLCYRAIKLGECETALAVGAESMSRTGLIIPHDVRWGTRFGHVTAYDWYFGLIYPGYKAASADSGDVALEYGETREEQDKWAYRSQMLYDKALREGKYDIGKELMAVEVPRKKGPPLVIKRDEQPRPDTTLEGLAALKPIYGSPTITPGNAPGVNDGASAVLIMSKAKAEQLDLEIQAKIVACTGYSGKPREMAAVPGFAMQHLLKKTNMSVDDIDLIEVNEAFAAMPLIATRILANRNDKKLMEIRDKTNVNGDAIAIGHPVGASGCRILMTTIRELHRRGGGKGMVSICGGLSQGEVMIIEV
ncbi:MAG: acetyl-CoA C-acyltransferase [Syntrophorhabdus sp.]